MGSLGPNELHIGCLNVRGIAVEGKINMMKRLINEEKLNIVLLQELKIHHKNENEIKIDWKKHFKNWKAIIDNNETGILINKQVPMNKFKNKSKLKDSQWITRLVVHYKGKKIGIGSYYRSPNAKDVNHIKKLNNEIENWKKEEGVVSTIIGGDFNWHSTLWDKYGKDKKKDIKGVEKVIELIDKNELEITNDKTKPTHCKYKVIKNGDNENREITEYSIIDLIICSNNLKNMIKSNVVSIS